MQPSPQPEQILWKMNALRQGTERTNFTNETNTKFWWKTQRTFVVPLILTENRERNNLRFEQYDIRVCFFLENSKEI